MKTDSRQAISRIPIHLLIGTCGFIIFQFFGNATRGYIDTPSLFYWWGFQWFNPRSQTEHGPVVLAMAAAIFWRSVRLGQPAPHDTGRDLWLGMVVVVGGLVLHFLGFLVQQTRISIAAFLVFIVGWAYVAGGRHWGRAAIFPCVLVLFAVPVEFLTDERSFSWAVDDESMTIEKEGPGTGAVGSMSIAWALQGKGTATGTYKLVMRK